jgi:hypothetical protein
MKRELEKKPKTWKKGKSSGPAEISRWKEGETKKKNREKKLLKPFLRLPKIVR